MQMKWGGAVLVSLVGLAAIAAPGAAQVLELLTQGADRPIYLTHAGDSRLFIAERDGRITIWDGGQVLQTPFLDISEQVDDTQEGGFLSFAFHPAYSTNGRFFVSYTTDDPQTGFTSIVSRFEVSGNPNVADPTETVLLRQPQPYANHNGGQLQFAPDGTLYVGFGDGGLGDDPGCRAQNPQTWLGKLLRIDVDAGADAPPYYSIPADNPYADPGDGVLDEIWGWGLRNPWRFSFDRQTGDLWIGDVGQSDIEEIDREASNSLGGRNWGWKVMEGTFCRNPDAPACGGDVPGCNDPDYEYPLYEYDHDDGHSISGGFVYRGSQAQGHVGVYFFADFGVGRIWSLHHVGGGAWQRTLLHDEGTSNSNSFASFGEGADGELYVLNTFGNEIFHLDLAGLSPLSPAPVPLPADPPSRPPYLSPPGTPTCGNGVVEGSEQCDDGNVVSGDGCSSTCQGEPAGVCGDGVLDRSAEQCDDGNTVDGDGCTADCMHESCGDGVVGPQEECDDGNTVEDDSCDNACRWVVAAGSWEVKAAKVGLKFNKPAKDKIEIKIQDWMLPPDVVPSDLRFDLGGAGFTGPLDPKGKYKSPDKRDSATLKQSKKSGLWKLTVKRKKNDFKASLANEGLTDADNPKPGLPVTVPMSVEVDGVVYGEDLELVYKSKTGKSGTAK
jgi:cysteine-rich repeat protein